MSAPRSQEDRDKALALLREGFGVREVARQTGFARDSVSRWAKEAGVEVDGRAQTEKATAAAGAAAKLKWAQRREQLADEIGEGLSDLLKKCLDATEGRDSHGFAMSFGTLIDKAQLLTGGATSRHEMRDADRAREWVAGKRDELADRRAGRTGTDG